MSNPISVFLSQGTPPSARNPGAPRTSVQSSKGVEGWILDTQATGAEAFQILPPHRAWKERIVLGALYVLR